MWDAFINDIINLVCFKFPLFLYVFFPIMSAKKDPPRKAFPLQAQVTQADS